MTIADEGHKPVTKTTEERAREELRGVVAQGLRTRIIDRLKEAGCLREDEFPVSEEEFRKWTGVEQGETWETYWFIRAEWEKKRGK